jgi:hypothetical protein
VCRSGLEFFVDLICTRVERIYPKEPFLVYGNMSHNYKKKQKKKKNKQTSRPMTELKASSDGKPKYRNILMEAFQRDWPLLKDNDERRSG